MAGFHGFGQVGEAAFGLLGPDVLICFGCEAVMLPGTVVLKLRSPTVKKLSSGWASTEKNHLMRF